MEANRRHSTLLATLDQLFEASTRKGQKEEKNILRFEIRKVLQVNLKSVDMK